MLINRYEIAGRMPTFKPNLRDLVRRGLKTKTLRVMNPQPEGAFQGPELYHPCAVDRYGDLVPGKEIFGIYGDEWGLRCPHGRPGDIRVLREPLYKSPESHVAYYDDLRIFYPAVDWKWRSNTLSSMFMPTKYGRTLVEYLSITGVRLHDITTEGAIAEGIPNRISIDQYNNYGTGSVHVDAFAGLWDKINGKTYPWSGNWWVWDIKWKLIC